MEVAWMERPTPFHHVAVPVNNREPAGERWWMVVTFRIALGQRLVAVNVDEEQLVELGQRAVVRI